MEGVPDIKPDEITIDENDPNVVLGEGAFGIVYRGRCRSMDVAIKMPKSLDVSEEEMANFKKEVAMMAKLFHPRIALFMGAAFDGDDITVVTELLDGDLEHICLRDSSISLYQRMVWAKQAAEGMAWVHGAGVIHRDLKPSNLLYSRKENSVKVCDFGFTILKKDKASAAQLKGSPFYIAPEVLRGKGATSKSDVYSFGIILHFLVTLEKFPLKDAEKLTVREIFDQVIDGRRPELPSKKLLCPSSLRGLAESCWDADPEKRPSFEQIIAELNKDVIIDCAVFTSKGRKFWKICFVQNDQLQEDVPWVTFLEKFCMYFTLDGRAYMPATADYKCMRELFSVNDTVNLRNFGRRLGFFGPLEKGKWMEDVKSTMREPWFWGDTSREIACEKLAREPQGTFLIRYASEDSYFTISYVAVSKSKKEIFHTRVVHSYGSHSYVIPTTRVGTRTCASLKEVVRALQEGTSNLIQSPCPNGPYSSFFDASPADGYVSTGFSGYLPADVNPDAEQESDEDDDAANLTGSRNSNLNSRIQEIAGRGKLKDSAFLLPDNGTPVAPKKK